MMTLAMRFGMQLNLVASAPAQKTKSIDFHRDAKGQLTGGMSVTGGTINSSDYQLDLKKVSQLANVISQRGRDVIVMSSRPDALTLDYEVTAVSLPKQAVGHPEHAVILTDRDVVNYKSLSTDFQAVGWGESYQAALLKNPEAVTVPVPGIPSAPQSLSTFA